MDNARQLAGNLASVHEQIQTLSIQRPFNEPVTLMAVSKYYKDEALEALLGLGHCLFGENKVQDILRKHPLFSPKGAKFHLIGHLQRNKVKKVLPLVDCIQSVDSEKLLHKINQESEAINKVMPILIQINVADDPDKFGFSVDRAKALLDNWKDQRLSFVALQGIMTIVPETQDTLSLATYFQTARQLFDQYQPKFPGFSTLSMGMSGDMSAAIQGGSTMVRVGSRLIQ